MLHFHLQIELNKPVYVESYHKDARIPRMDCPNHMR